MDKAISQPIASQIFVGRQPIYDKSLSVVAYELLFRGGRVNEAGVVNGFAATSQVIVNAFMEIGVERLVEDKKAFVNFPRQLIVSAETTALPPERVVVEILEDVTADDEVLGAVRELAEQGYTIALDDFVLQDNNRSLIDYADIIKVDIMALGVFGAGKELCKLNGYKGKLLAEKVETQQEFESCKMLGFDYFQGYFFAKPQIVEGRKLTPNRLALLELLEKLYDPDISVKELETVIVRDVALSYKLLKVVNSACYALPNTVESVKHALTLLGLKNIRNWVGFLMLSGIDDKPTELFKISMIRAKMCQLLAESVGVKDADGYFTVGLFSNLDALMDQPLADLLGSLPLSEDVQNAVLRHEGRMGEALGCTVAYEHGDWDSVGYPQVTNDKITAAYLEALAWAGELTRELGMR